MSKRTFSCKLAFSTGNIHLKNQFCSLERENEKTIDQLKMLATFSINLHAKTGSGGIWGGGGPTGADIAGIGTL